MVVHLHWKHIQLSQVTHVRSTWWHCGPNSRPRPGQVDSISRFASLFVRGIFHSNTASKVKLYSRVFIYMYILKLKYLNSYGTYCSPCSRSSPIYTGFTVLKKASHIETWQIKEPGHVRPHCLMGRLLFTGSLGEWSLLNRLYWLNIVSEIEPCITRYLWLKTTCLIKITLSCLNSSGFIY